MGALAFYASVEVRGRIWRETWPRLIVIGCALVVAGVFVLGMRGSARLGPPPPYNPPVVTTYTGAITYWHPGTLEVGGWVESDVTYDCPRLLVWVATGGRGGYVEAGPLPAQQRISWVGIARDPASATPVRMSTAPSMYPRCVR